MHPSRPIALASLLLALPLGPLAAQSLWPRPLEGKAEVGLEWVRPTFVTGDDQYGFSRGVWILGGRIRASERINVVLALPQIRAPGGFYGYGGGSGSGTPYIGVEFLAAERRPEFSLGIRLGGSSSSSSDAGVMALYGDYDRWEEGISNALVVNAIGHTTAWQDSAGASARVRFGGTILIPAGGMYGGELYVDYGIRFGRDTPALRLGVALTGRWLATGGGGASLAEATIHQVAGDLSFGSGMVRPSFGVRLPLDDALNDVVEYVLIGGVTVHLK